MTKDFLLLLPLRPSLESRSVTGNKRECGSSRMIQSGGMAKLGQTKGRVVDVKRRKSEQRMEFGEACQYTAQMVVSAEVMLVRGRER